MAGVPPLIGFYAKQAVLTSAVKAGYVFLSVVGVVTSVISAAYYLHLIRQVHFEKNTKLSQNMKSNDVCLDIVVFKRVSYVTPLHSYIIASLTLSLFLYTIYPDLLLNCCRLLALTLYNT